MPALTGIITDIQKELRQGARVVVLLAVLQPHDGGISVTLSTMHPNLTLGGFSSPFHENNRSVCGNRKQ